MSATGTVEKSILRAAALAQRDMLPQGERQEASAAINDTVVQFPLFGDARVLCCYMSIGSEVQTADIILTALSQGKQVALPRTLFHPKRLALHLVTDLAALVPGQYNIPEPPPDAPQITTEMVDVFLIPGVAFDSSGNRLGYGAGFYDGLLAGSRGCRVALAYAAQIVPQIPADAQDIPMQYVVTERGVIDCRRGRQQADHLRLRNMQFYGHHGAFPEERAQGIRLAFDIDLRLDVQWPGLTDDLIATVDYPAVARLIQQIQSGRQFHLLEALAEEVARAILAEFPLVAEVMVAVRKFHPPIGSLLDAFEVEITRGRVDRLRRV